MSSQCHSVGVGEGGGRGSKAEMRDLDRMEGLGILPLPGRSSCPGKGTSGYTGLPWTKVTADAPGTHSGRLPWTGG